MYCNTAYVYLTRLWWKVVLTEVVAECVDNEVGKGNQLHTYRFT